jgi:hypothetical protein
MSALRDAIVLQLQSDSNIASAIATARADAGRDTTSPSVYPGLPSKGTAYPFITVTAQKPPAGNWVFQQVGFEDATYLVKAIDQNTSAKTVGEINALIRTALNLATLTITGYTSMGITWIGDIQYDEPDNGIVYQHEGGLYLLMAEPT